MYLEYKSEYFFVCLVEGCKWLFFYIVAFNFYVFVYSVEKDGYFLLSRLIEDGRKRCGYCGMLFIYNENFC